jgi:hypothetical protein
LTIARSEWYNANITIPIFGSLDPRVNDDSVLKRQRLLSRDISIVRIDGGDHHQFGSYQIDPEDRPATIGRASQQQQITQATLQVLETVSGAH